MARLKDIVIDARQPALLARFWAAVLDGYAVAHYDAAELARLAALGLTPDTDPSVVIIGPGPRYWFVLSEAPSQRRNRLHLDLSTPDIPAEVARLVTLGASVLRVGQGYTVMADPEGNNFCLFASGKI